MSSIPAEIVINALTIAAGMALVIERIIELCKPFLGSASGSLGKGEIKDLLKQAADAVAEVKDALAGKSTPHAADFATFTVKREPAAVTAAIQPSATDSEASEQHPPPKIPVLPPTPLSLQETSRKLFYILLATALGIFAAVSFKIHLIALLMSGNGLAAADSALFQQFDLFFSGVVMGGGSQPVHAVIKFLTERKSRAAELEAAVAPESPRDTDLATLIGKGKLQATMPETAPLQWQEIVYNGGINPASLQSVHLRPGNPNLVVYHHTAMSSSKSFQDIVNEFLVTKQWLTGYHCVIMPDGTIKPFCRWDRSGNHAKNYNARSLGLSFHGNFHLEQGDQFSNVDGRYGNQRPTEAQLHAGARVIALWCYLYPEIELDFDSHIVPHKALIPGHTVCPGSNFDHAAFQQLVRDYHQAWATSSEAQTKIAAFKQLDYLYV